jgi:CRISPR/Cas system CMR-associated protein Cmr5 small subunit
MHLDQERARRAFAFVQTVASRKAPESKQAPEGGDANVESDGPSDNKFLALARKLPVMLQTNGLFATWAHLLAKDKEEHRDALNALTQFFHFRDAELPTDREKLFQQWIDDAPLDGPELRRWTAEAIEYSVWLKRAAEALLDTGDDSGKASP